VSRGSFGSGSRYDPNQITAQRSRIDWAVEAARRVTKAAQVQSPSMLQERNPPGGVGTRDHPPPAQEPQPHVPQGSSSGSRQVAVPPVPSRVHFQNKSHVVGECIGKGAFATVHALTPVGASAAPGPLCAKLVYPPSLSPGGRERVKTEMQLWEQLSHPNIIRFMGRAVEEQWLVLVLERAEGGELFTHVQSITTTIATPIAAPNAADSETPAQGKCAVIYIRAETITKDTSDQLKRRKRR